MSNQKLSKKALGAIIRRARTGEQLSQAQLAEKVGVSQVTVSNWERGKTRADADQRRALEDVLGPLEADGGKAEGPGPFGSWLTRERTAQGLSVPELAAKAKVSSMAIYNIEGGRSRNPHQKTRDALERALRAQLPQDAAEELSEEQMIEGVGEMQDFDPHSDADRPTVGGVYVFYDISDRPVYVGEGQKIRRRIRDHVEKFWFKSPIVQSASYIQIEDRELRKKVERILIKFLKSNAVINKQHVER